MIISLLRFSDLFLTLIIIANGGIEANFLMNLAMQNWVVLIVATLFPIVIYFFMKSYKIDYFKVFVVFNSILLGYEIFLMW